MSEIVTVPAVKRLDGAGRCCGRKPIRYQRPRPHLFCCRCNAEFTIAGEQRANWAFVAEGDGFVSSQLIRDAAAATAAWGDKPATGPTT